VVLQLQLQLCVGMRVAAALAGIAAASAAMQEAEFSLLSLAVLQRLASALQGPHLLLLLLLLQVSALPTAARVAASAVLQKLQASPTCRQSAATPLRLSDQ
jgi:hypothetical protein